MKLGSLALGTLLCGTAFGFIASGSITTIPKQAGGDSISPAPMPDGSMYATAQADLPDHYPLITRSGRIEVEDLWKRRPLRMRPYMIDEFAREPELLEAQTYSDDLPADNSKETHGHSHDVTSTEGVEEGNGLTVERVKSQDMAADSRMEPIALASDRPIRELP